MLESVLYTAGAIANGGRDGRVISDDGNLNLRVATPVELGGAGGATNPEQLFAAGFAACFHNALLLVARQARQDVTGSSVTARVGIGKLTGSVGYSLRVDLAVELPGVALEAAHELIAKADTICPYSNATRGNIVVTHQVG
ncbi:organic hydroperoxide resistance protein [Planosporangium flavigriseum]|uniref:Organic hydroperoxide resistance protein n=1 Tax=Planosporangium flavigriseum TaxID=373681 RepID=A0A8J3LRA5_9ACTN|nr:organic hydroperoxide resistance protein [Planosporangium flavigriseum]NJC63548.1 organic hydroperoxide resistance protein [Planosporangium flavigriseum]GIG72246.1 organic hydroperoxide resistance protein [Planosporangium flavigriseum]